MTNGDLGQTLSFDWPLFLSPVFGDYFDQTKWPGAQGLVKQNFLTFLCTIMLMAFTDVSREVAWPGAAWHIEGLTSRIITTASCVNNTYKQKKILVNNTRHIDLAAGEDWEGEEPVCRVWQNSTRSPTCKAVFRPLFLTNFFKKLEHAPAILCRLDKESEVVHHLQKASEKSCWKDIVKYETWLFSSFQWKILGSNRISKHS